MLSLSENEYETASQSEKDRLAEIARESYLKAGADHIIEKFTELPEFIKNI
jgi:phosphoglycolate phosphatase-like HAD superfamily hydrolase